MRLAIYGLVSVKLGASRSTGAAYPASPPAMVVVIIEVLTDPDIDVIRKTADGPIPPLAPAS